MAAQRLVGACACGSVAVEIGLCHESAAYTPRACDCDYCRERDAAWLSDPAGFLRLHAQTRPGLKIERQGSGQAEFLSCASCGSLLAVRWLDGDGHAYGAVNARSLTRRGGFAPGQCASPKLLEAGEKPLR